MSHENRKCRFNATSTGIAGREVYSENLTGSASSLINIPTWGLLPSGMYFVKIINGADEVVEKLVVE